MENYTLRKIAFCSLAFCSALAYADVSSAASTQPLPYDADLFSKDREVIYVDTELLVMTLLESGLEFDSKMNQSDPGTNTGHIGNFDRVKYQWRPGFRLALGYFNAPKYWDVMAQYVWFETRGNKHEHKPDTTNQYLQPVDPILPSQTSSDILSSMKADLHYRYNVVDGLVARNFFPNPHLRLRFVGGLTTTWQNQSMTVRSTLNTNLKNKNAYHWGYWGIGFRAGAHADWYWGKDFYLTGRVFGAVTIGHYVNTTKAYYQASASSAINSLIADNHYADYRGAYNFQFVFGPSWQKSFPTHRFELFLGYEVDSWFNLAQIRRFTTAAANAHTSVVTQDSPLTMNGVTLRLTTSF